MKVTGTLVLVGCLLVLLVPTDGQRFRQRGHPRSRGRNRGRGLRRLATAGLLFGAGTAVGVALARGRRDVSLLPEDDLGLMEDAVLTALQQADSQRCMEQWLCDIMARPEDQRAEEEQDMAMLFEEDAVAGLLGQPGSPRSVYLTAAARGLRAAGEGDMTVCQQAGCPVQPDQLLLRLQTAEESSAR